MKDRVKFYLEKTQWRDEINIHIITTSEQGRAIAQPIMFMHRESGESSLPALSIDYTEAQQLMDSLCDCGLRPLEGSGSAGSLAATQRHLEDMRKLVFESTKKKGEEK